jgi:CBS-domain-containing membrane protein
MLQAGVSGLPVLDSANRLVGIITEADFVDRRAGEERHRHRLLDHLFGHGDTELASAATVSDVMSRAVVTVGMADSVTATARRMVEHGIKRLPVVDSDGRLLGIVSRADVIKAFVRSDDDIARDVVETLERLPIDPGTVEVGVRDGMVTLHGEVDGRPDALLLEELIGNLDGVVAVDSRLEWIVDDRIPEQRWAGFAQEGAET